MQERIIQSPPKDQTPLTALSIALRADMDHVNDVIISHMRSDVVLINNIAQYLISSGGKRIRPLLTLAVTTALGGNKTRAHGLAATIEFIHSATLLHDDVVDESHERRGKAAANDIFGNQASVLVGDFLFSRAFQLMVADGSLETLRILSDASAVIAEGEVLQLQMQGNLETSWDDYIRMIGAKTAALFAAACEVGAVVSDTDSDLQRACHDYGHYLGLAFQMADDLLDYAADAHILGKTIGDDFREGKISAPVLLAYHASTPDEKAFWTRTITRGDQTETDLATAQSILAKYDIINQGMARADAYAAQAKAALEKFPASPLKDTFSDLCTYVVRRGF